MKKACKRGGKLLLIALFILGTLQMDMVVPDAKAVTQAEIDDLRDNAGALEDQKADLEDQLASLENDMSRVLE